MVTLNASNSSCFCQGANCNCCISIETQYRQLQPVCGYLEQNQNCSCMNLTNANSSNFSCACVHPSTAISVPNLAFTNQTCYCNQSDFTLKPCNCCVSRPVQIVQLQPQCLKGEQKQGCLCTTTIVNGISRINCACNNTDSNVTAANIAKNESECFCQPSIFPN